MIALADYDETPAWYVSRRTPYSLIKGGRDADEQSLKGMVLTCARRCLTAARTGMASAPSGRT